MVPVETRPRRYCLEMFSKTIDSMCYNVNVNVDVNFFTIFYVNENVNENPYGYENETLRKRKISDLPRLGEMALHYFISCSSMLEMLNNWLRTFNRIVSADIASAVGPAKALRPQTVSSNHRQIMTDAAEFKASLLIRSLS